MQEQLQHGQALPWVERIATIGGTGVRIAYIDCHPPPSSLPERGTLLLIHGFPQTSYQFRHVIEPLSSAGYRVVVPDYRGAGRSSRPDGAFTKTVMAADLSYLVHSHLGIRQSVHVVGHDIGGMVAHAYASRYPDYCASVILGECPLPGTDVYEKHKMMMPQQFHFVFHRVADLPEALVAGREDIYLRHFFDKISFNAGAITQGDLDRYVADYSQPGAMRCAFGVYRAFETDALENREWLMANGKCRVPALGLSGEHSLHAKEAAWMLGEVYEDVETALVEEAAHYIAEENPEDFVRQVLAFVERHS
ncbi:Alpha/beta hydrolase fold-1 [Macrophomina phaseolina MS6]|uniref:Alpha/beta hydrolase fold-1 n=2 Tax=Macrophomina phaseolina TaxID=35725 RepID=K2S343_MACPH|nr:Alpha/beta hydrolase fold-1 [Macrophomina phaseolina MS6]KAH7058664.1 soluble epoxide hydrolase [Macrophomina phaseolina]